MPNMDTTKQSLYAIGECIDKMNAIMPIIESDFNVKVPGLDLLSKLPPDRVQAVKDQYAQLQARIKSLGNSLPDVNSLG